MTPQDAHAGGSFKRKDLIGLEDLSRDEIKHILDVAESFRELSLRTIKKVPTLRGKSVVMMFMEPSTRTKVSFDIAAKRLSADGYGISGSSSSAKKGETLMDTALNLAAMHPDIIVLRHKMCGSSKLLAEALPEKARHPLEVVATAFGLFICVYVATAMVNFSYQSFERGARTFLPSETLLWPPQAIIAIGAVLLSLQILARLVRLLIGDEPDAEAPGSGLPE